MKPVLNVYLAGPIGDISWDDALMWRKCATERLGHYNIKCYNPMSTKLEDMRFDYEASEIPVLDLNMVRRSDILLADMRWDCKMIGTPMEIQDAWRDGKFIILFGEENRNHYWLQNHATKWLDTLDEALSYIVDQILPYYQ